MIRAESTGMASAVSRPTLFELACSDMPERHVVTHDLCARRFRRRSC
jgi:hypothetical protein